MNRRSLIDATEKPLRRSISPQNGPCAAAETDWPTLEPSRASSPELLSAKSPAIKSNVPLGELDHRDTDEQNLEALQKIRYVPAPQAIVAHDLQDVLDKDAGLDDLHKPAYESPERLPSSVWRAKGITSGKRSSLGPVRQTKTSSMRAQLAFEGSQFRNRQPSTAQSSRSVSQASNDQPVVSSRSITPSSRTGALRSAHQGVTARGSPYAMQPRSSNTKTDKDGQQKGARSQSRPESMDSLASISSAELVAVKEPRLIYERKSSIPKPRRHISSPAQEESEADASIAALGNNRLANKQIGEDPSKDADVDTDVEATATGVANLTIDKQTTDCSGDRIRGHPVSSVNQVSSVKQKDMTPNRPSFEVSATTDEKSDVGPMHSFSEFDPSGYLVRRLSKTAPDFGPTLRISQAAEKVIMGEDCSAPAIPSRRDSARRNSAPDLRRSLIIREALKKSKDGIIDHLQMRRSSTAYSLAKAAAAEDEAQDVDNTDEAALESFSPTSQLSQIAETFKQSHSPHSFASRLDSLNALSQARKADDSEKSVKDWPLKTVTHDTPAVASTPGYLADIDDSWISPLTGKQPAKLQKDDSVCSVDEHVGSDQNRQSYPPRLSSRVPVAEIASQASKQVTGRRRPTAPQTGAIPNRFTSPKHSIPLRDNGNRGAQQTPNTGRTLPRLGRSSAADVQTSSGKDIKAATVGTSGSKKVFPTLRGLFHKRSAESPGIFRSRKQDKHGFSKKSPRHSDSTKRVLKYNVTTTASVPPVPQNTPQLRTVSTRPNFTSSVSGIAALSTPTPVNADSTKKNITHNDDTLARATGLAHKVLDLAAAQRDSPTQGKLLELGHSLATAINAAKEAEQAGEIAKIAAAKAEMSVLSAKRCVEGILGEVMGVIAASAPA